MNLNIISTLKDNHLQQRNFERISQSNRFLHCAFGDDIVDKWQREFGMRTDRKGIRLRPTLQRVRFGGICIIMVLCVSPRVDSD